MGIWCHTGKLCDKGNPTGGEQRAVERPRGVGKCGGFSIALFVFPFELRFIPGQDSIV